MQRIVLEVLSCTFSARAARAVCKGWAQAFSPCSFNLTARHSQHFSKLQKLQSFSDSLQKLTVSNAWVLLDPVALAVCLRQLTQLTTLALGPFTDSHLELYSPRIHAAGHLGEGWAQAMGVVVTLPSLRSFSMECPLDWLPKHRPLLLDELRASVAKSPLSQGDDANAPTYRAGLDSVELRLVWTMQAALGVECSFDFHLGSPAAGSTSSAAASAGMEPSSPQPAPAAPAWEVAVHMPDTHAEALAEFAATVQKAMHALLPGQEAPARVFLARPSKAAAPAAQDSNGSGAHALRVVGLHTSLSAGPRAEALLEDALPPLAHSLRELSLHVIYNAPAAPAEVRECVHARACVARALCDPNKQSPIYKQELSRLLMQFFFMAHVQFLMLCLPAPPPPSLAMRSSWRSRSCRQASTPSAACPCGCC